MEGISSAAASGECRHSKVCFYAVFEGHRGNLMVNDVVVATVYASAVRAFLDSGCNLFSRKGSVCDNVPRPTVFGIAVPAPTVHVVHFRTVRAGVLVRTVDTSIRCACGLVFLLEVYEVADGRNTRALGICIELQKVEVVTALCQNHGGGNLKVSPVASNVAVCLVHKANAFQSVDNNKLTDCAFLNKFRRLYECGSVTKYVANEGFRTGFLLRRKQSFTFFFVVGEGLFRHNVVAKLKTLQTMTYVTFVRSCNDKQIRALFLEEGFFILEASVFRNVENLAKAIKTFLS